MKNLFIYALCEPGTRKVRYIGMTMNLKRRLRQHISESVKNDSLLGEWLRSLSAPPNMVTLCETSEAFWQDEETRYIRGARALGMPLVNSTDGGEGSLNPSPETRMKLSAVHKGVPKSPECRAKTSAALTGVLKTPSHRAAISAAKKGVPKKPFSPEHRASLAAALKGVPKSPAHRAAISAAAARRTRRPNSPEQNAAIGIASKASWTQPEYRGKHAAIIAARRLAKLSNCPPVV